MLQTLIEWKDAAPILGAIIALVSVTVAFFAFRYTRSVNRRRATLDMVLKTFIDDAGRSRYNSFKSIMERHKSCDDPLNIMTFSDPDAPVSDERRQLRDQINEYELIALGIRKGVFDEKIYKLWFQNQFIRDYESLEEFISKVREKRPSVFCEFVRLYTRWKKSPHPENAPGRIKLAWWGITRNEGKLKEFSMSEA